MAEEKTTDKTTEAKATTEGKKFAFPKLGVVIEATSRREAQEKVQETKEFKAYKKSKENK